MPQNNNPLPLSDFFSLQRLSHVLIIIALLSYFIIIAKSILIPITFAMFFAFMLKPIYSYIVKYIPNDALAIILSFLAILLPIMGILTLFSLQVAEVFQDLPSIGGKLKEGIEKSISWIHSQSAKINIIDRDAINNSLSQLVDGSINFVQSGLSSTPSFFISLFITFAYTFFFLYYKKGLRSFIINQFAEKKQSEISSTITKIKQVAQKYLYGLGLVILLMGILNSLGLFLIGIKYPILWGFLAALLTVIPYIGTALGGLLPFLYAAATTGTIWQPSAVLIYYFIIQQIEGNLITPSIIGNSVSINAMTAIISLIIGGFLWGVAGVVLALPIIATIRIIFAEVDSLKPIALLMSNELYLKEDKFKLNFNKDQFRLSSIFRIKPPAKEPKNKS